MRILAAIDSFKGSLSSLQAGSAVKEAALEADPGVTVTVCPLADGGEGTVDALVAGLGGETVTVTATGPLGTPVQARYGILPDGTAVLEMSAAAGITLVPEKQRDPMVTTTYGVGEMILDAVARGCRQFVVGIGGSATNDGGTGMLSALGYEFLDDNGRKIAPGAAGLAELAEIRESGADPRLKQCQFRIACDVTNPLCGAHGCSAVFAPQKGAKPEDIPQMDRWLAGYARLSGRDPDLPGAGAAGGMGFAFSAFLNGTLESGIQIILEQTGLEERIRCSDLVITGEGKLDGQTVMGKAPIGVAHLAKKHGKQVIAFAGCVTEDASACLTHGIDAYYAITPADMPLEQAMDPETAYANLKNTALQVLRQMRG